MMISHVYNMCVCVEIIFFGGLNYTSFGLEPAAWTNYNVAREMFTIPVYLELVLNLTTAS